MKRIIRYLFKRAEGGEKRGTEEGGKDGDKKWGEKMAGKGEGTSETMCADFVGREGGMGVHVDARAHIGEERGGGGGGGRRDGEGQD